MSRVDRVSRVSSWALVSAIFPHLLQLRSEMRAISLVVMILAMTMTSEGGGTPARGAVPPIERRAVAVAVAEDVPMAPAVASAIPTVVVMMVVIPAMAMGHHHSVAGVSALRIRPIG